MRNISFSLTTPQILARTKTVTRRLGWKFLKPGDRLSAVRKAMGLRPGEKIERLATIEVVSARREQLDWILGQPDDCAKEGFPEMTTGQFVDFFCEEMGVHETTEVTRIEFKYV